MKSSSSKHVPKKLKVQPDLVHVRAQSPVIVPAPVVEPAALVLPIVKSDQPHEAAPDPMNMPEVIPASGELAVPSCSSISVPVIDLAMEDFAVQNVLNSFSESDDKTGPLAALGLIPTSTGDFVHIGRQIPSNVASPYIESRFEMSREAMELPSI